MGNKELLTIYTDGACSGNPGPGGWSVVQVISNEEHKAISGNSTHTTNNRMELIAIIKAIQVWGKKRSLRIYTDSKYCVDNYYRWYLSWKNKDKSAVKNLDLWSALFKLTEETKIQLKYCPGHSDIKHNEMADQLAVFMCKYAGGKQK